MLKYRTQEKAQNEEQPTLKTQSRGVGGGGGEQGEKK